jgi:polyhydroxyalkanoate synthesis regulator phasin
MFEEVKKAFDKGVEYAFATKDKIEKAAMDFAKENNLTKEEAKKLIDQWVKKSELMKKDLEKHVAEFQKKAIAKMDLVTKEDYKALENRIKKLEGVKVPARRARKAPARKIVRKKL